MRKTSKTVLLGIQPRTCPVGRCRGTRSRGGPDKESSVNGGVMDAADAKNMMEKKKMIV